MRPRLVPASYVAEDNLKLRSSDLHVSSAGMTSVCCHAHLYPLISVEVHLVCKPRALTLQKAKSPTKPCPLPQSRPGRGEWLLRGAPRVGPGWEWMWTRAFPCGLHGPEPANFAELRSPGAPSAGRSRNCRELQTSACCVHILQYTTYCVRSV